jgi:hypothetical protein
MSQIIMNTINKPVVVFHPEKSIQSVKLCKNCRYFVSSGQRCKLFGNVNVVDGSVQYNYAHIERTDQYGKCGIDAKYWDNIIGEVICQEKLYDKLSKLKYKTLSQMIEESENNNKYFNSYWD